MFSSGPKMKMDRQCHQGWMAVVTEEATPREASQLLLVVGFIDLDGKVMKRRRARVDGGSGRLTNRQRLALFEHSQNVNVASVAVGDFEEGDALELLHELKPEDAGVKIL